MKKQRFIHILLIIIFALAILSPAVMPTAVQPVNAHPVLAEIAVKSPQQRVSVIVQVVDDYDRVEGSLERLGGEVTKNLQMINAFAAEVSASAAMEVAGDPNVRWVSLDGMVESTKKPVNTSNDEPTGPYQENYYLDTTGVRQVWDRGLDGKGVTVAVIDSGIFTDDDFGGERKNSPYRIVWSQSFSTESFKTDDANGHGTHVAGIVGGNGAASDGLYSGVAPNVNLINLKISDETGMAYESDVVAAMQWVFDNKDQFNIRVVNISLNSTVEQSYHTSPIDAAVEILWFNGVVVVASVGNTEPGGYNTADAAPANDPFIITVGASDELGTADPSDDLVAPFSAFGTTMDGYVKPDIIAPGKDIVSVLAWNSDWILEHLERVVMDGEYFRISGTSMAAPVVSGAVALLLQDEPNLTPDQVKYRLMNTGRVITDGSGNSYPYLDAYSAVTGNTTESANTGLVASQMLWSGDEPVAWDSVAWNSVAWNSVAWNSVAWNSVAWNSVAWNSVAWND